MQGSSNVCRAISRSISKSLRRSSIACRILSVARAMVNCSKPEAPHMAESLSSSQRILRFGTFEVNPRSGELRKGGVRIKLHGQPFEVLAMLLERHGENLEWLPMQLDSHSALPQFAGPRVHFEGAKAENPL